MALRILITALAAYFLGNHNGAICVSAMMHDDVRSHGSGNAGLTNFIRNYGASRSLLVPGICLIVTGVMLFLSDRIKTQGKIPRDITYREGLIVGIAQGFAFGVHKDGHSARITALEENIVDPGFLIYPNLDGGQLPLGINPHESFVIWHNSGLLPIFAYKLRMEDRLSKICRATAGLFMVYRWMPSTPPATRSEIWSMA